MTSELSAALASELAGVFGALIDTAVVTTPTDVRPSGRHWVAIVKSDNPAHGTGELCFDEVGANAVTALIMGLNESPPEASILDTLREVLTQALSSTSFKEVTHGVLLRVAQLDVSEKSAGPAVASCLFEAAGMAAPLLMSFGGNLDLAMAEADTAADAAAAHGILEPAADDSPANRIDVILDIDLPLIVRFGRTELPLRTLARMGPGSLIDLGRSADDPVDVLVSNRVVARGEVVIVGGNYGVRILDVVSPKERIRSMEA
ncbi:MAG TPA: FliM/FliN family flagellar motor switch protein [Vicinamibacterales bacterium]|jgi:flagellar motor switch protein FliN/FliY|nr:FliM/FliN family flagellar motor switch protein [Vicinamibacterales bacterium]